VGFGIIYFCFLASTLIARTQDFEFAIYDLITASIKFMKIREQGNFSDTSQAKQVMLERTKVVRDLVSTLRRCVEQYSYQIIASSSYNKLGGLEVFSRIKFCSFRMGTQLVTRTRKGSKTLRLDSSNEQRNGDGEESGMEVF